MQKNNASIGSDVIENIIKTYPELNLVWLITGEGNMLKTENKEPIMNFQDLPPSRQKEIELIIEEKIRERQEIELKRLLIEVTKEIESKQG
jgi:hypothetical protein